jgi:hypothetical protein
MQLTFIVLPGVVAMGETIFLYKILMTIKSSRNVAAAIELPRFGEVKLENAV